MIFRALHISDVHFDNETASEGSFRERISEIAKEEKIDNADCLIISGDLFNTTLRQNAIIHFGIFSAMPRRRP